MFLRPASLQASPDHSSVAQNCSAAEPAAQLWLDFMKGLQGITSSDPLVFRVVRGLREAEIQVLLEKMVLQGEWGPRA